MTEFSQVTLTYIKKAVVSAASLMILVSAPAMATGPAAPTDIADKVAEKNSDVTPLGAADEDFRALFANWQKRDDQNMGKVAIPSRLPVDKFRLTSRYGYREDPFRGRRKRHKGIDMAAPIGTPIYATADGVVGRAQWVSGYGKYIEIEHGGDIQTRYGHMSRLNVAPNQKVKRGDLIGFMGSTGRSTGSHLHYEVRINGEPVNPEPFLRSSTYLLAMQDRLNQGQGGPEENEAE
ncbi:M23 family metallopeptidase [Alterisphingorhabdus coralli]|uniref:M23 family metallopeptidase n=1 Tax=Alterisphingorhabdus coralli TaxID=3071408 RepID=A0AA97FA33_9SPHN|nr:M23 family metallopeptidase [Parasphingorhabdus sp. SCSIO 66989]WOE76042.1 M23 family metallopeptidase [Parasphingorhabdus sp. SCSIO 66989]